MIGGDVILLIRGVQMKPLDHLVGVIHAKDAVGLGLGLGQGRQQQRGKYGDDGDDHQQLNQRETGRIAFFLITSIG